MRKMVKTVLELPNGELWLSALDRKLDDESWAALDETHPQFELKQLLDYLDMPRELVTEALMPGKRRAGGFCVRGDETGARDKPLAGNRAERF